MYSLVCVPFGLQHGVISDEQLHATMQRMASVVDRQNSADPTYIPMAGSAGDGKSEKDLVAKPCDCSGQNGLGFTKISRWLFGSMARECC